MALHETKRSTAAAAKGAAKEIRRRVADHLRRQAAAGTIRQQFGQGIERNSVHGSDSPANAGVEIGLIFKVAEIVG